MSGPPIPVHAEMGLTLLAMFKKEVDSQAIKKGLAKSGIRNVFPTERFASESTDTKVFSSYISVTTKDKKCHIVIVTSKGTLGVIFECYEIISKCESEICGLLDIRGSESCTDQSKWLDPEPPIVKYMPGGSERKARSVAVIDIAKTHRIEVHIKAYAVRPATSPLAQHLNNARLSGDFGDESRVVLCTGGGELVVHRFVITSQSPVFARMFQGDFKESKEGRVDITDVPKEVAEKMLEFLYLNHVEDMAGFEIELIALADKYMIKELKRECEVRMWTVTPLRAVELLEKAYEGPLFVSSDLRKWFVRIILDNWALVQHSAEWKSLLLSCPAVAEVILASTCPNSSVTSY